MVSLTNIAVQIWKLQPLLKGSCHVVLKSLKLLTSSLASNQLEFHCCLSPALLSKFGHDNLCWKELWCFCQNCLIGLKRVNFFNSFLNLTHSIRQWRSHLLTFVMWASWKKLNSLLQSNVLDNPLYSVLVEIGDSKIFKPFSRLCWAVFKTQR